MKFCVVVEGMKFEDALNVVVKTTRPKTVKIPSLKIKSYIISISLIVNNL